jgi:phytoene synthase
MTMAAESQIALMVEPAVARRMTEEIIRSHSKTFYFATRFLPAPQREAVRALYAFCRATDDLVDQEGVGCQETTAWRLQVRKPPQEQANPILYTWSSIRARYGVDERYEEELIDGVEMDIDFRPFETWADLERYCYRVASTVGLLSMPIIGLARGATYAQADRFAIPLGIALQLTNILRDVGEDAARGRIYLPLEDLRRFGLTLADIAHAKVDQRFIDLMKFEIERARSLYRQSLPGIRLLSPSARLAVGAAAFLYQAILEEIEAVDYQVFSQRAHTSAWRKLFMLPGIIWRVNFLKAPQAS